MNSVKHVFLELKNITRNCLKSREICWKISAKAFPFLWVCMLLQCNFFIDVFHGFYLAHLRGCLKFGAWALTSKLEVGNTVSTLLFKRAACDTMKQTWRKSLKQIILFFLCFEEHFFRNIPWKVLFKIGVL